MFTLFQTFVHRILVALGIKKPDHHAKVRRYARTYLMKHARFQPQSMSYREARARHLGVA